MRSMWKNKIAEIHLISSVFSKWCVQHQQHPSPRAEEVRRCRGRDRDAKRRNRARGNNEAHPDRTRVSPPPPAAASAWACAGQQSVAPGLMDAAADSSNSIEIALAACFAYHLDQVFKSGTYVRRSGVRRNAHTAPAAGCGCSLLPHAPFPSSPLSSPVRPARLSFIFCVLKFYLC